MVLAAVPENCSVGIIMNEQQDVKTDECRLSDGRVVGVDVQGVCGDM